MLQVSEMNLDDARRRVQRAHDSRIGCVGLKSASIKCHELVNSSNLLHRFRRDLLLDYLRWKIVRNDRCWLLDGRFLFKFGRRLPLTRLRALLDRASTVARLVDLNI